MSWEKRKFYFLLYNFPFLTRPRNIKEKEGVPHPRIYIFYSSPLFLDGGRPLLFLSSPLFSLSVAGGILVWRSIDGQLLKGEEEEKEVLLSSIP